MSLRIALIGLTLTGGFSSAVFAEELQGITQAQCLEKSGRVGDYDTGCGDSELVLGRVVHMKCPCYCCVPAKADLSAGPVPKAAPEDILRRIPNPDRKLYKGIQNFQNWQNPFLMVGLKDVKLLGRNTVRTDELIYKLVNLPPAAWPYGRVVAVQVNPNADSLRKHTEGVKKNLANVIKRLKDIGIEVELWPSA